MRADARASAAAPNASRLAVGGAGAGGEAAVADAPGNAGEGAASGADGARAGATGGGAAEAIVSAIAFARVSATASRDRIGVGASVFAGAGRAAACSFSRAFGAASLLSSAGAGGGSARAITGGLALASGVAARVSGSRVSNVGRAVTTDHTMSAAATLTGTNHPIRCSRHQGGAAVDAGVVRAIAASIAWQRTQSARWASAAERSAEPSFRSAHAASVSASRHPVSEVSDTVDACDMRARSASRVSRSNDESRSICSFFTSTSSS